MAFSGAITVAGRFYNEKNADRPNVSRLYTATVPVFAALGWLVLWCFDFSFDLRVLPYSLGYGVTYTCFTVGILGALQAGSTSLTALIKQLALVGVSLWGFLFWDVEPGLLSVLGLALIVVSLILCLLKKETGEGEGNLAKWLFYALLITVGNAGCSIIQRYQQMAFQYQHKNMLMFFGVFFSCFVTAFLARKEDRTHWKTALRKTWVFPALSGLSSSMANLFVLILTKRGMSSTILYPGMAVGGLMLTVLFSFFGFKERLRPLQWCGLIVGAAALVLLNL